MVSLVTWASIAMSRTTINYQQLPISQIPNEILSQIFFILRDYYYVRMFGPHWLGDGATLDWICITHVCHHWREVALDTPLLWSYIVPQPVRWVPELLQRSKQSPLTIFIHYALNEELKVHLGRARKLVLYIPSQMHTIQQVFSQPTLPGPETLVILTSTSFTLTDSHLHRDGEALRRLSLHGCSVNWNSKLLLSLTLLRLTYCLCRISCLDFVVVLSKIPTLESLHLCGIRFQQEIVPTHQQPAKVNAHLQRLQNLSLNGPLLDIALLLSCLIIPRSSQLTIYIAVRIEGISESFRSILSWISNQLHVSTISGPSDPDQCIRSLRFIYNPDKFKIGVQGYCDVLSHEQLKTADHILDLDVWWDDDDDDDDPENNLITFLSSLPLDCVAFLDVFVKMDSICLSTNFWSVAFGKIPTLETVYLNAETSNFWPAINPLESDGITVKDDQRFLALDSITVISEFLDFHLVLDNLRVRSTLGGRKLFYLSFLIRPSYTPSLVTLTLLEEVVSYVEVLEDDADDASDSS